MKVIRWCQCADRPLQPEESVCSVCRTYTLLPPLCPICKEEEVNCECLEDVKELYRSSRRFESE